MMYDEDAEFQEYLRPILDAARRGYQRDWGKAMPFEHEWQQFFALHDADIKILHMICYRLLRRFDALQDILEKNGCDCDCDHHHEEHDGDCVRCLACRISAALSGPKGAL